MPFPVPYFFQILPEACDILLMLHQLIIHFLDQMGALISQLGQMDDGILYQVEPVDLVLDPHVEGSGDGAFLQVAVNMHVVVIPLKG